MTHLSFQSCCIPCLENDTAFLLAISSTFIDHFQFLTNFSNFSRQQGRIVKYSVQIIFLS